MTTEQFQALLRLHQDCGISLVHSVSFIYAQLGKTLRAPALQANVDESLVYRALRGERHPSKAVRQAVRADLSVDPWEYLGLVPAAETSTDTGPTTDGFRDWLRAGLTGARCAAENPALVHRADEGLLLLSPAIFQHYAGDDWFALQRKFLRQKLHAPNEVGKNFWHFQWLAAKRRPARPKGVLIPAGSPLLADVALPPVNALLVREGAV